MLRSTKIVATLGPASSDPAVLERMVRAGVDVVRLNFSHGTADDHLARATLVKEISRKTGRTVAIMCDLQGPKIRVGKFKDGKVMLQKGQAFVLDAACDLGDGSRAGLDYKELPRDVGAGSVLLLDDGKIVLDVTEVRGEEVLTKVRHGGVLSNNKGINRQGGGLTAPALTPKDIDDIRTAASPTSTARSPRATMMPSQAFMMSTSAAGVTASARSILAIRNALPPEARSNSRAMYMSAPVFGNDTAR